MNAVILLVNKNAVISEFFNSTSKDYKNAVMLECCNITVKDYKLVVKFPLKNAMAGPDGNTNLLFVAAEYRQAGAQVRSHPDPLTIHKLIPRKFTSQNDLYESESRCFNLAWTVFHRP